MSFTRYPTYKKSGVDWLGEVPNHWDVKRLKHLAVLTMGQSPSSDDCNQEGIGLPFLQGNADFGDTFPDPRSYCAVATKVTNPNDILFSVRAPVGAINISDKAFGIGRGLCAITAKSAKAMRFLFYALQVMRTELFSVATGSTYDAISTDQLGNATCFAPPHTEQIAIATFLDRETVKIDALILEQQSMMELLKEKRQAVISEAVTKGLDPEAPMKPSGIAWPDLVPAHWEVLPLTRVIRQFVDYRGVTPEKLDEGIIPLITATQIKNGRIDHTLDPVFISEEEYKKRMTRGFPEKGDVLLTTEAPLGETAQIEDERVSPGQRIILMKVERTKITNGYLYTHFRSAFGHKELWIRASGSTASGIRADRLRASIVLVPPLDEQDKIVKYIARQISQLPLVEEECRKQIRLLLERRAALISAAVTGQIDVRQLTVNHTP
jgi:type I restriction enzyme S subunit